MGEALEDVCSDLSPGVVVGSFGVDPELGEAEGGYLVAVAHQASGGVIFVGEGESPELHSAGKLWGYEGVTTPRIRQSLGGRSCSKEVSLLFLLGSGAEGGVGVPHEDGKLGEGRDVIAGLFASFVRYRHKTADFRGLPRMLG